MALNNIITCLKRYMSIFYNPINLLINCRLIAIYVQFFHVISSLLSACSRQPNCTFTINAALFIIFPYFTNIYFLYPDVKYIHSRVVQVSIEKKIPFKYTEYFIEVSVNFYERVLFKGSSHIS